MNTQQTPAQNQPRLIRVFVSSTFKDMQEERDELVKFIFPQLRKLCEQRGVTWGEVDLRWGITDEQKSEGKVLPVCLGEIQRCRPYFIGILGQRYGWIPDEIPAEMIEREPWLKDHFEHSVTEMEILHGVLNNHEMAEHACFYFRDRKYLETIPPEQRVDYLESDVPEDIEMYGAEGARQRTGQRKEKLADLKERIRGSGFPVHEDYQNPKEFGKIVLRDLIAVIEELYPEGSQPDPLEREATEHEIFAKSRAQVYIGRRAYFDRLEAHAHSESEPLVILGESGSGKSALLANWAIQYRKEHPDELVVMHFIGATSGSADWAAMLRRILGEIKRKFDLREEIPDKPDALRSAFANWLNMAAARGRVILVLDALNQLEDRHGALDLVWLPPHVPENVRMILSTLPGHPLDELQKRGWPVLTVEPLQVEERSQLITEYLALFSRALGKAHTERIANAAECHNPLFLRVLLDELRLFGKHEQLGERIGMYLGAANIPALYEMILERCEQDYERERPGLVRDAMSLLWASRRGLSEIELMELLGVGGQPLPRAYWSPLYLSLEQSFLSRGGLIGFFHDYLRQAVQNGYLSEQPGQIQSHLRLADYFEAQSGASPRRLDELPWQLAQASDWQRLNFLLGDLEFFKGVWKFNPFDAKVFWVQVEAHSPYRILDAYRKIIDHPDLYAEHIWGISMFLADMGHFKEALALRTYLTDHYRKTGDKANLAGSLGNQANILDDLGLLDQAMTLYQEQERICRELGNKSGLGESINNQAVMMYNRGDLDEALALHKIQEGICRELGDKAGMSASLGNQANILYTRGDLEGSMLLHKQEERICREMGNKTGLQRMLNNMAVILEERGDLDGAMALHKETESISRDLGDKVKLHTSLNNQGTILYIRGDLTGAMTLWKESERICRELGDKVGLHHSLNNQGAFLNDQGDRDGAMALHKESERICRELGDKHGLIPSLSGQAAILRKRDERYRAMALYKENERICRELGNKKELAITLINQASLLVQKMNLPQKAVPLADEAYRLANEYGYTSLAKQIEGIRAKIRERLK